MNTTRNKKKFIFVMMITIIRAPLALLGSLSALANLFHPHVGWVIAAAVLMTVSAATDWFDGKCARAWNVTSALGAQMDLLMDKIFYVLVFPVAVFIAMWLEDVPHALTLLFLDVFSTAREQWIAFLRTLGVKYAVVVKSDFPGKLRTFVGMPVAVIVHIRLGMEVLQKTAPDFENLHIFIPKGIVYFAEWLFIILTAFTLITYTKKYLPCLRKAATEAE